MLLVLAAHAAITFQRETSVLELDRRQEGERLGHVMALAVGREWDRNGRQAALALLDDVNALDADVKLRWLAPDDASAIGAAALSSQPVSVLRRDAASREVLHSYVSIVPAGDLPGRARGVIDVTQELTDERARVRGLLASLGLAVAVILAINAVLATLLSNRWVRRPVAKLFSMAQHVGGGDFSERVSLTKKSGLEFSMLGGALNEMAGKLEDTQAAREYEEQRRRQTEAQLRHAERLTTVGKLASGVAHEMGTPLNVIMGHADMIRRHQVAGSEAIDSAETIAANARRITRIIEQLLGFARRSGPERSETDLSELSRDTLLLLDSFAKKRGVTLLCRGTDVPQKALVDQNQLQQVLINLITNGVQSMADGGTLSIDIDVLHATPPAGVDAALGEYVRIQVTDTGEGIPAEHLQTIFEPFFTTKDVGEGTGLGLSVIHGIISDHGGWIRVESEVGKGSTFSVFVPRDSS